MTFYFSCDSFYFVLYSAKEFNIIQNITSTDATVDANGLWAAASTSKHHLVEQHKSPSQVEGFMFLIYFKINYSELIIRQYFEVSS